jgi:hypothetical protein
MAAINATFGATSHHRLEKSRVREVGFDAPRFEPRLE